MFVASQGNTVFSCSGAGDDFVAYGFDVAIEKSDVERFEVTGDRDRDKTGKNADAPNTVHVSRFAKDERFGRFSEDATQMV